MMMIKDKLDLNKIYHLWWLHDARWYQEVATEFGFDAANRLNKKILNFIAKRIGFQEMSKCENPIKEMSIAEIIDLVKRCAYRMWPEEMVQFSYCIKDQKSFEMRTIRNYSLYMLELSETLEQYECPCQEIREGWFVGMGLELQENSIEQCCRHGSDCCVFQTKIT